MLRFAVALFAGLLAARAPGAGLLARAPGLLALTMPGAGYAPRAHAPRAPTPRTPFRMPRLDAEQPSNDAAAKPRRRRRRGRRRRGGKGAAAKEKTDVVIGGPAAAGAAASWARGRRRDDVKPKADATKKEETPEKEMKRKANREAAQRRRRRRRRRAAAANRTKVEKVAVQDPPDAQKRCVCGYCGEVFASRSKLFRHLREANSLPDDRAVARDAPREPHQGRRTTSKAQIRRLTLGGLHRAAREAWFRPRPFPKGLVLQITPRPFVEEPPGRDGRSTGRALRCGRRKRYGRQAETGFPKGKIEPVDRTILAAALRETWEEAGLAANQLRALPHAAEAAANASARLDQPQLFSEDETVFMESDGASEGEAEDVDEDDLKFASVDVREVTGRSGKRARYFVCGLRENPPRPVELTTRHDVDGDIADASWVDVNAALVLLERKRRAALRRAVLIYNADERGAAAAGKASRSRWASCGQGEEGRAEGDLFGRDWQDSAGATAMARARDGPRSASGRSALLLPERGPRGAPRRPEARGAACLVGSALERSAGAGGLYRRWTRGVPPRARFLRLRRS